MEGKVHIPRSPQCLPDQDNEGKKKIAHHCSFITQWALGPLLKVDFLTPVYISWLVGTVQRDAGPWVTKKEGQCRTQLCMLGIGGKKNSNNNNSNNNKR